MDGGVAAALLTHRCRSPGSIPDPGALAEIVDFAQKWSPPGIEPVISRSEHLCAATELKRKRTITVLKNKKLWMTLLRT